MSIDPIELFIAATGIGVCIVFVRWIIEGINISRGKYEQ